MGPLFVLIFWAIVAGVLSIIGGVLFLGLAALLTRDVKSGRKRALMIAAALPACGFAYLFVCVMLFSVWSTVRGRDMGWGDSWDTPILGNYHLMMIDVTDKATVYDYSDPKVYSNGSLAGSPGQKGVIFGVRRLDVHPPYLIGAASPESRMEYPLTSPEPLFFILDTNDGSRRDLASESALNAATIEATGKPLQLRPVDQVYNQFRYTKIDLIPVTCFGVPPLIVLIVLGRAFFNLRRGLMSSTWL